MKGQQRMQGESGLRDAAVAWHTREMISLSAASAALPMVQLGVLPAADRVSQALMASGGGVARSLRALSTQLDDAVCVEPTELPPWNLRGIGFALGSLTAESLHTALYSADSESIADVARAWHRLAAEIDVASDDWERTVTSWGAERPSDHLVTAELHTAAIRLRECADLLDAISTGVRHCQTELARLENHWAAAQVELRSPAAIAAYATALQRHERACRDAAARSYNQSVDRWERRTAAEVAV